MAFVLLVAVTTSTAVANTSVPLHQADTRNLVTKLIGCGVANVKFYFTTDPSKQDAPFAHVPVTLTIRLVPEIINYLMVVLQALKPVGSGVTLANKCTFWLIIVLLVLPETYTTLQEVVSTSCIPTRRVLNQAGSGVIGAAASVTLV